MLTVAPQAWCIHNPVAKNEQNQRFTPTEQVTGDLKFSLAALNSDLYKQKSFLYPKWNQ